MAFTATDLSNVESAIITLSTGESIARVTLSTGKTVEYQKADIDSLIKLRGVIQADVQAAASAGGFFNKARFDNPI